MKDFFEGFKLAFSFLTIIPFKSEYNDKTIKNSIYFYPAVGLFTGLILFFAGYLSLKYAIKFQMMAAAFLLLLEYLISNFFHVDGFCDTVDALYFTKPGKDKLAILRDPHIGAYAVVWLIILILFKYCAYHLILTKSNIEIFLIFPVIGYLYVPFHTFTMTPLFEEGLGKSIKKNISFSHCLVNTLISFFIVYIVYRQFLFLGYAAVSSFIFIYLINKLIFKKFGGFNGDTIGFGIETLKLLILISFSIYSF